MERCFYLNLVIVRANSCQGAFCCALRDLQDIYMTRLRYTAGKPQATFCESGCIAGAWGEVQDTKSHSPSAGVLHRLVSQRFVQALAGQSATPGQVCLPAKYRQCNASAKRLSTRLYRAHYVLLDLIHLAPFARNLSYPTLVAQRGECRAPPPALHGLKVVQEKPRA